MNYEVSNTNALSSYDVYMVAVGCHKSHKTYTCQRVPSDNDMYNPQLISVYTHGTRSTPDILPSPFPPIYVLFPIFLHLEKWFEFPVNLNNFIRGLLIAGLCL